MEIPTESAVTYGQYTKQFCGKIRNIRKEKGISKEELTFRSGLHRTYMSYIERGARNVSLKNIEKIAKALRVKSQILFS